jgi:hypothetical protein
MDSLPDLFRGCDTHCMDFPRDIRGIFSQPKRDMVRNKGSGCRATTVEPSLELSFGLFRGLAPRLKGPVFILKCQPES